VEGEKNEKGRKWSGERKGKRSRKRRKVDIGGDGEVKWERVVKGELKGIVKGKEVNFSMVNPPVKKETSSIEIMKNHLEARKESKPPGSDTKFTTYSLFSRKFW
jgi:hypothetical protein